MIRTEEEIKQFNEVTPHNGFTNQPTQTVKLWIDSDEELQDQLLDRAQEIEDAQVRDLEEYLEKWLKNEIDRTLQPSLLSNLLSWTIAYVDFQQLAFQLIEDAEEIRGNK